jgi:hypothetical protein
MGRPNGLASAEEMMPNEAHFSYLPYQACSWAGICQLYSNLMLYYAVSKFIYYLSF